MFTMINSLLVNIDKKMHALVDYAYTLERMHK